jgi:hypothetical protein
MFLKSSEYAKATAGMSEFVRQMSVFAEHASYSLVEDGQATLMGQRSPSVAKTITDAGAVSNLNDDVVQLMFGSTPR